MAGKKPDHDLLLYYSYKDIINNNIKLITNNYTTSPIPILILALLKCNAFCHLINNSLSTKPIVIKFQKLLKNIINNRKNKKHAYLVDSIIKEIEDSKYYEDLPADMKTPYRNLHTKHARVLNVIAQMLDVGSLSKLFNLTRLRYGYCNICDTEGEKKTINLSTFSVNKTQMNDEYFNLEDSLYAERTESKPPYHCETCGTNYKYKVSVTVKVPEILIVQMLLEDYTNQMMHTQPYIPRSLTIPCDDNMTHYYRLTSYLEYKGNEKKTELVVIGEDKNKRKFKSDANLVYNIKDNTLRNKYLFFYTKVGSLMNYDRDYL